MIKKGSSNYPFSIDSKIQIYQYHGSLVDCIYKIPEENL